MLFQGAGMGIKIMLYIFVTRDELFDFDLTHLCEKGSARVLITCEDLYVQDRVHFDGFFTQILLTEDFSYDALEEIVGALVTAHPFEGTRLLTCDEEVMIQVARLREKYALAGDGVETTMRFTHKDHMKAYLRARAPEIEMPRYELFDARTFKRINGHYLAHLEDYLHLPVFVKPVNQCSSHNAAKIETNQDLRAWCNAHVEDETVYEMDEFIEGDLYHCDSVVVDGRIASVFISRYNKPCFDFLSGHMSASILLPFDAPEYDILAAFNAKTLEGLDVPKNAVTHLEVFRTHHGRNIFLEVALRPPGARIPKMYDHCLGVNIQKAHFKMQLGKTPRVKVAQKYFGALCEFPMEGGVVAARSPLPELESACEVTWFVEEGARVEPSASVVQRACVIQLWHKEFASVERDMERLSAWKSCTYIAQTL